MEILLSFILAFILFCVFSTFPSLVYIITGIFIGYFLTVIYNYTKNKFK